jgi:hypothetical protein
MVGQFSMPIDTPDSIAAKKASSEPQGASISGLLSCIERFKVAPFKEVLLPVKFTGHQNFTLQSRG